jgi:glycosyltransferase involved in cell wall biosynthesis
VGGIPEIIEDQKSGFLYEPERACDLRRVLEYVLENPSHSDQVGSEARERILRAFSWSKRLTQIVSVYREVLDEGSAG